jgi:hypothetical protein
MAPGSFPRQFTTPAADDEIDLPDPLDAAADAPAGDGEDLLSQLAGDAVNRMMDGGPAASSPDPRLNPVQELTSQLDTFFEELRQRQAEAAAVVDSIPEAQPIVINDDERAALNGINATDDADADGEVDAVPPPPRGLLDSQKPVPVLTRPLHWCGGLIESLSPGSRALINVTAILSFLAACAALAYVLLLRRM